MPRRTIAALATAVAALMLATSAAHGAAIPIVGQVGATYERAGGEHALGMATTAEAKLKVSGVNVYAQRFERGGVIWSSKDKGTAWLTPSIPALSGVKGERDALARYGFTAGQLLRTGELCKATSKDKRMLAAQMRGGTIVDLRQPDKVKKCKDPTLPGVANIKSPMTSTTTVKAFVTKSADRKALGKALKAITSEDGPVLVHCTLGRDRTGWTVAVIMSLVGADQGDVYAEYLRTAGTREDRLMSALDEVAEGYDDEKGWRGASFAGMYRYATDGLGLTDADIARLRAKFGERALP